MNSVDPQTAPLRFGRRALPALAAATGLAMLATLPFGEIVLSADGRLTISTLHAGLGLATLALAVLGPSLSRHRAQRGPRFDRVRERRFDCECHLVGIATIVLLLASLHLAAAPQGAARIAVTEALPQ